jgi:hypothetical protein
MKVRSIVLLVLGLVSIINSSKALIVPSGAYNYQVTPDGMILETINLDNEDLSVVNVTIIKQGFVNQWIFLQDQSFSINPSSSYTLSFYVIVPEIIVEGNYSGNITFNYASINSTGSISRVINFDVRSTMYTIVNGVWLYNNMAFSIGDYKLYFTSVSPPNSCFTKITKNGFEIFNEPIDNNPVNIDEHLKVSVTQAYSSESAKSCRYVITGDEEYIYQITDIQQSNNSNVESAKINVYGLMESGLPVMFELVDNNNRLLSGKLIITSPIIGAVEILGDGLYPYTLQNNETGPLAVKAYYNTEQVAHRVFTILGGESYDNNGSNNNHNYPVVGSGKLLVIYQNKINPTDNLIIKVKDNYTGNAVIDAYVWVKNPCGIDVESYTNPQGVVSFSPPSGIWCNGQYSFDIRRAGYEPNPSNYLFSVQSMKTEADIYFYYSGTKVSKAYVDYEVIAKLVDYGTELAIDYDGYGKLTSPNGNLSDIKFIDGIARFTPRLNGEYNVEVTNDSFSTEGVDYSEINKGIDVITYGSYNFGIDSSSIIPILIFIIVVVLLGIGCYIFLKKGKSRHDDNKIFPKIQVVPNRLPPNSEPFK